MQHENLKQILEDAKRQLREATCEKDAEEVRIRTLGKKGSLTDILRSMGGMSPEERKEFGKLANETKGEIEKYLAERMNELKKAAMEAKLKSERIDVTENGRSFELGVRHPLTITIEEMTNVFRSMGYSIVEGPEIETVWHNFDALNSPKNHPSRDMTDTFYLTEELEDNLLLRTHTSPVQIRTMLDKGAPIKIAAPGRCFRCDTPDATHSPMFHQVEGLVIGEGISMADLKGTLHAFAQAMFGSDTKIKLRPSHFPFTEPSAEVDVSCFKCGGKGCNVCKDSGWIEVLGCGMVHPNVIRAGGLDPEKVSGFAFGIGVERVAMLKYGVDDIRLFYENDMRFIEQF